MAQIGIDVGGSGLRAARVEDGRCGEIHSLALDSRSVESVLAGALSLAKQCGPYNSIGVAVPGFADGGIICSSPNFPQWRDVPFGTLLADRASCPVHVENDASAAAWGAYLQRGSGEDLVLLTLGTGVGGGVVSGGQLLRGASGCAAEIGHMYVGGDRTCGCGARGCLETWISTGGLIAGAAAHGRTVPDGRAVLDGAAAGEDWARAVCAEAGEALGRGLRNVVNLLNPDTVLIAGGLSAGQAQFEPGMMRAFASGTVGPARDRAELAWLGRADSLAIVGVADLGARRRAT
jgi:glucokinase